MGEVIKVEEKGFTLIEVLIAFGILAFTMTSALKIFSSNAKLSALLEENYLARVVAENILIKTMTSEDELIYSSGLSLQAGREYLWVRDIDFSEDGSAVQINITINQKDGQEVSSLLGYKVL